jgi:uncharacterized protein YjiS (DUF1127 family)
MNTLTNDTLHQPGAAAGQPLIWRTLGAVGAWYQQLRTEYALMNCSDRVLDDIGIAREDIRLVARGQDPLTAPEHSGWLGSLRSRLEQVLAAGRERRRDYAELMAYSDQELDELGIKRSDIPAVLQGRMNPKHA